MQRKKLKPLKRIGPLFETKRYWEAKDPCIVFDGTTWHIYGSGVSHDNSGLKVLHATAPHIEGPWIENKGVDLGIVKSPHIAAPGVTFDPVDQRYHMAIQDDFTGLGGKIDYFASQEGQTFSYVNTMLEPIPHSHEAGLYDPHLSTIKGEKYLVYAGITGLVDRTEPFIPQPDIFLAKSTTGLWAGPWERQGKILDHDDVTWHHNRRDYPDYEWGIEGPQLIELPSGKVLLNATCFLETGKKGTRQRVFFAIANDIKGPYRTIGPVLDIENNTWESGENGHSTSYIEKDTLYLFYQARGNGENGSDTKWRYGIALFSIFDIEKADEESKSDRA